MRSTSGGVAAPHSNKYTKMNTVEMRLDIRVPLDLYDFLQEESRLKKLSFEGLILLYIRSRMNQERRK